MTATAYRRYTIQPGELPGSWAMRMREIQHQPRESSVRREGEGLQEWLERLGECSGNQQFNYLRDYMRRYVPPVPHARIVDFGCYMGANLIHFGGLGHEVVGIEASREYVRRANEDLAKHPELAERVRLVHGLVEDFVPDKPFDVVLCGEMLCYVDDIPKVIAKAWECLGSQGEFYATVPIANFPEFLNHFAPGELVDLIRKGGFVIQHGGAMACKNGTPVHWALGVKP